MAIGFKRVLKTFGFDESKTEKYVVTPNRALPVSSTDLCEQVALISGKGRGEALFMVETLVKAMKTFIQQGHTVNVEGLGSFIPSFNAKSSTEKEKANADSIYRMKLRFVPCEDLRDMMNNLTLVDCTPEEEVKSSEESSSEEKPEEL